MNLLKFIELQRKETILHRIPIPIKILLLITPPLLSYLPNLSIVRMEHIYLATIIILALLIVVCLRAPRYVLDIFLAFLVLYVFGGIVYVARGLSFVEFFVERKSWFITLLYIAYSVAFFLSTTSIEQLELFLMRIRIPKRWIIAIIIAYNLIPALYYEAKQVIMHQKVRGHHFSRNPLIKMKQLVALYIPMIFVSLMRAEHLEISLRARGY